ncbi:MAG: restriction endonuclease [Campylobacterales bacterium]
MTQYIYISILIFSIAIIIYDIIYIFYLFSNSRYTSSSLISRYNTEDKLKTISWQNFEKLSMELFARDGWSVRGNEKAGADGGVDIWMSRKNLLFNTKAIVQCKRYTKVYVGIKVVREMYGLMYAYGVDRVYIVTTSRYTKECYKFIKGKNITLIDGKELLKLINSKK